MPPRIFLSAVRAKTRALSPALIDACLACLDQITQWLAIMEATEELPEEAEAEAAAIIVRLAPPVVPTLPKPQGRGRHFQLRR